MLKRHLPVGLVVPVQPVERDKPPVGAGWAHEIKRDGYRLTVRKHLCISQGDRCHSFT
jgi:ATP-dependent DNA ligase